MARLTEHPRAWRWGRVIAGSVALVLVLLGVMTGAVTGGRPREWLWLAACGLAAGIIVGENWRLLGSWRNRNKPR
jgi:hypothetical protein